MSRRTQNKKRNPRRVILVICEGETEAAYVSLFRRHYRLPITIKSKIVGNKINKRLINQILAEEGLKGENDSYVLFMYDSDVEPVIEKLRQLEGLLVISNPCIEFWYLLHHQEHSRFTSAKEVLKILKNSSPIWTSYSKGTLTEKQKEILLKNQEVASTRARILNPDANPSTNMYQFLEILEIEKNR